MSLENIEKETRQPGIRGIVYIRIIYSLLFLLLLPLIHFRRPISPVTTEAAESGRHPSRGRLHPHGRGLSPWTTLLIFFAVLHKEAGHRSCPVVTARFGGNPLSALSAVRTASDGVWCGWLYPRQATTSETAASGRGNGGHRLPAWLRHGAKWPPGKIRYLCLTWPSADLEKATSSPATVSALCSRDRLSASGRAPWGEAPGLPGPRRLARLSACGAACRPGSPAGFQSSAIRPSLRRF